MMLKKLSWFAICLLWLSLPPMMCLADNDDIDPHNMKYAAGGGVRYAIDKKEKINLRIDIGVSPYGIFPYVLFQEAF